MMESVAPEDLRAAVEEKEKLLGCRLQPWEVKLLNCQLLQVKMKNMPKDQKTPLYKSQLKSLSDKIARMKRKSDFREDLLLPKKTASTVAQRVQRVNIDVNVIGDETHAEVVDDDDDDVEDDQHVLIASSGEGRRVH